MASIKASDREGLGRVGLLTTGIFLWVSSTRFGLIPLMCKEGTKATFCCSFTTEGPQSKALLHVPMLWD